MSFGWGAGDILAGIDLIKTVIEAIKCGPSEYREIHRELSSLNIALNSVQDGVDDPESLLNRKGRPRKQELLDILEKCRIVVIEVQGLVDQHSSLQSHGRTIRRVWDAYRVGSADLDTLRGRLTFYTSTIDMFLHSLEGPALARIEGMVTLLVANMGISRAVPGSGSRSIASVASTATILSILDPDQEGEAWKFLRAELMAEGILPSHLKMYKMDIIGYLKTLIEGAETPPASPVSDQRIDVVRSGFLFSLRSIPAPKSITPIPPDSNEWRPDGLGQFETRLAVVRYGVLKKGNKAEYSAYLVCFEVRAASTFVYPETRSRKYHFNIRREFGMRTEFERDTAFEGVYPDADYRYLLNARSKWEVLSHNQHVTSLTPNSTANWTLMGVDPERPYRPPTFRLAALFRGTPVAVVFTIRKLGTTSSGSDIGSSTMFAVGHVTSQNARVNDVLGTQDLKRAASAMYYRQRKDEALTR